MYITVQEAQWCEVSGSTDKNLPAGDWTPGLMGALKCLTALCLSTEAGARAIGHYFLWAQNFLSSPMTHMSPGTSLFLCFGVFVFSHPYCSSKWHSLFIDEMWLVTSPVQPHKTSTCVTTLRQTTPVSAVQFEPPHLFPSGPCAPWIVEPLAPYAHYSPWWPAYLLFYSTLRTLDGERFHICWEYSSKSTVKEAGRQS
jgi:hypothetical protein